MLNPDRSLDGFVFGKVPIQHRVTMPSKPAPIRRTESPKGASPNSRRRGGRRTTNLRNTIVQGRPRRGRISVSQTGSCVSTDGRPLRGRSFRYWTARRFVGQALLAYGYSDSPPPGTLQPTRGSGTTDPYDTEGRCRRNQHPYAARSPRRGLLPIAVGEEDERRRTYGTKSVQGRASSKRENIGVSNRQLCFCRWASPSGAFLLVLGVP